MLATWTTQPFEEQLKSLAVFNKAAGADADLARLYAGVFFEGNYMSREFGWRGVHNPDWMRLPAWDEWSRLQEAAGGRIRVFNVDPSLPGALPAIAAARKNGVCTSMGHCGPDAATIRKAVEAGADLVTHFGNGAPPTIHRHRNPFWTWLADPRIRVGLIADGHHLPGDLLITALKAKGQGKAFLVSDAASTSGLPPGVYGGVEVDPNGFTHPVGERELLAGAWHQVDRCVERLCELGWSLADAWRQASDVPAKVMGIPLPKIAAGEPAEFVQSRWTDNGLSLEQVVVMGEEILMEPVHPRMV
jgi:N-acetylglucosamine-6-phosphate deacetylase